MLMAMKHFINSYFANVSAPLKTTPKLNDISIQALTLACQLVSCLQYVHIHTISSSYTYIYNPAHTYTCLHLGNTLKA